MHFLDVSHVRLFKLWLPKNISKWLVNGEDIPETKSIQYHCFLIPTSIENSLFIHRSKSDGEIQLQFSY